MKCTAAIWAIVSLGLAPFASAREQAWPSTAGWEIAELSESCGMLMDYEGAGETQLSVIRFADGGAGISISNHGWSAKPGQTYDLTFYLDDQFHSGKATGLTTKSGRRGFGVLIGGEFTRDFARASSLRIYLGETLVDQLSLKGSAAALSVVDRCVSKVAARLAVEARERARLAHIPSDPFAQEQSAPPRGNPASWVTPDDYPPAARLAREEGAVKVDIDIDTTGRIAGCRIAKSSGSVTLDSATCALVQRRGRYQPATDAKGVTIASSTTLTYRWSLSD